MSVFTSYAQYYDLLYHDKDYVEEVKFVDALLKKYLHDREHGSLLDLGCGTGVHAIELAKRGYAIQGVDFSAEMLERANGRLALLSADLQSRITFSHGDICTISLNKKFTAVISLFHVMGYQQGNTELQKAFAVAKEHLESGGVFIFDCWYGPAVLTDRPSVRVKRLENDKIKVTRIAEPHMHPNDNVVDVEYQIVVEDKMTKTFTEFRETHRMRYLFRREVELLCSQAGFEVLECGEWMTGEEPGFGSWNVYFVARG